MPLTPGESDRLLLHLQASLARARRDRGLQLNVPEARALIADAVCEFARDGMSWTQARDGARALLSADEVLPGVVQALAEVRVEARFEDGTRLVIVPNPFGAESFGDDSIVDPPTGVDLLMIANESATDIGISSHIHLAEVNPRLRLDRAAAFGMRAAIPTGTTSWIPAGESRPVPIQPIGGARIWLGTTGLVDGPLDDPDVRARALDRLRSCGYLDLVNGEPVGSMAAAESAIARVMEQRLMAGGRNAQ